MASPESSDSAPPPTWFTRAIGTPAKHATVEVDGATIAYRAYGERGNRGIVLVHGGAAHARWWDHIAPLLATGHQVVAPDLSGHGDSGRRDAYSLDQWAHEVLAVAADAGFDAPPTVIGHSMGGFVTLRAASIFGARIAGAVAIDSPVRDITPEERAARERRAFGPLVVYPSPEAAVARFHPIPDQPGLPYVIEHVAATSIRAVDGGWSWKFDPRVFARHQLTPALLTRLDCRVALFRAEHGILSPQMSEVMYDRLGRLAPVIEIPAAGHHVTLDYPLALVTGIRTLLSDWDHSTPATPRELPPRTGSTRQNAQQYQRAPRGVMLSSCWPGRPASTKVSHVAGGRVHRSVRPGPDGPPGRDAPDYDWDQADPPTDPGYRIEPDYDWDQANPASEPSHQGPTDYDWDRTDPPAEPLYRGAQGYDWNLADPAIDPRYQAAPDHDPNLAGSPYPAAPEHDPADTLIDPPARDRTPGSRPPGARRSGGQEPPGQPPRGRGSHGSSRPGGRRRRGSQPDDAPKRRPLLQRMWVRVTLGLVATFLVIVGWSVGNALTVPGGGTVSDRLAEWARDHYLSPLVTFGEWLTYQAPKKGGKPSFSLTAPGAARATKPAKRHAVQSFGPPPALQSLAGKPLPGEGQWRVLATAHGSPAIYGTYLRASSVYTSYVAGIASMNQSLVRFELRPGSEDPGPGNWKALPYIAPGTRVGLLATFNSGFKIAQSDGGFYLNGATAGTLTKGVASVVYYRDGRIAIGAWGQTVRMTPDVVGVRQNLHLIVDNGQIPGSVDNNVESSWGATLGGGYYVWRSGIGITQDGRIIFVYGPALNVRELAELLKRAGAVTAMQLDINPEWMSYMYYLPKDHPADPTPTALLPTQMQAANRYYSITGRDFTAVYAR